MKLAITEAHRKLPCGLGVDAYLAAVHFTGFSGTGLQARISEEIESCQKCETTKFIISGKSPLTQSLLLERGPDDFINNCLQKVVLQCLILDEAGTFFLTSGPKTEQVYIMVGVELVTYRCHLIPMQDTTTKSLRDTSGSKRETYYNSLR